MSQQQAQSRPALGALSLNTGGFTYQGSCGGSLEQQPFQKAKFFQSQQSIYADENQRPQSQAADDFDFEIYQDFPNDNNKQFNKATSATTASVRFTLGDEDEEDEDDGFISSAAFNHATELQPHQDTSMPTIILDDESKHHATTASSSFFSTMANTTHFEDEEEEDAYADVEEEEERVRRRAIAERELTLMSCVEYRDDILRTMREAEHTNRPKVNYMQMQKDITNSMRAILVDWLVEVSEEYQLHTETLYLAVNYTDRFLSQLSVVRGKLQLVGTTSIYIASKLEEIMPPNVKDFVYITDDTYTEKQVLQMEHLLLKSLQFRMNTPTPYFFLQYFICFLQQHEESKTSLPRLLEPLACYLAELTLINADTFLRYLPSQIAKCALYLAVVTLGSTWTQHINDFVGFKRESDHECLHDMHLTHMQAATHPQQAVQEKYKQQRFSQVSLIEPLKSLPDY